MIFIVSFVPPSLKQALHEALDSRYPHIVREEEQPIVVEDASLVSSSGQSKKHAADPIEGKHKFKTPCMR